MRTRDLVEGLLERGWSSSRIARELDITKSTVCYHARQLGFPAIAKFGQRFDWVAIRAHYEAGYSVRECAEKFGFSRQAWATAVTRGAVVPRPNAAPIEKYLVIGRRTSRTHLKGRLLAAGLKDGSCEDCGLVEWQGKPVSMCLHHINGDGLDNRLENLRFLCPNCHSLTPNFAGRGRKRRVTELRPAA